MTPLDSTTPRSLPCYAVPGSISRKRSSSSDLGSSPASKACLRRENPSRTFLPAKSLTYLFSMGSSLASELLYKPADEVARKADALEDKLRPVVFWSVRFTFSTDIQSPARSREPIIL